MFIKSIELQNFGLIEKQELLFTEGINMFCGDNGKGKSTVLKAISLLLFNQFDGNLADYIRWRHEDEGFYLKLEFNHLTKDYELTFEYSKKKSLRILKDISDEFTLMNSAAIEYLNDLLDFKRAISSIVSFENNVDLISTSPSQRREYLKNIYDLTFKPQLKSIEEHYQSVSNDIISLEASKNVLESQTFEKQMKERLPISKERFEEITQEEIRIKQEISKLELQVDELDKTEKKYKDLDYNIYLISNDIEKIKKSVESIKISLKQKEDELNNLEKVNVLEITQDKEQEKKLLSDKEQELAQEIIDLSLERDHLTKPRNLTDYINKNINRASELRSEITIEIRNAKKDIEPLKNGVCPTCGHKVEESYLKDNENKILGLEEKLKNVNNSLDKYNQEYSENKNLIDKYSKDFNALSSKIDKLNNEINYKINPKLEQIDDKYENIINQKKNDYNLKKQAIENSIYKSNMDFSNSQEKLKSLYEEKSKLEKEQQSLKIDDEFKQRITASLFSLKDKSYDIDKQIKLYNRVVIANEEKEKLNKIIEAKEKEKDDKLSETTKEIDKLYETKSTIELSKKILSKEFPSYVISRMITNLKIYANQFLQMVYPKYELDIKESKSALKVLYGPNKKDVKLASGFEQQIFSFAWKYALGKIQNYGMLILDEVDSAASTGNSEKFYNTLAKMYEYFPQIFVVSHKPEIQELLSNDYQANVFVADEGIYFRP